MLRALQSQVRQQVRRMSDDRKKRLIWVDCEMTGLDADKQTLVEIATIVTDEQLNIVAEGPNIIIHQPDSVLANMEQWPRDMFEKNGLMEKIKSSEISLEKAEQMTLSFLREHTEPGASPLAGNTVYMDRIFIRKYMPQVEAHMHYRIVDVSTVKELTRRWHPATLEEAPKKAMTHRALDDIRESIAELAFYRQRVFQ